MSESSLINLRLERRLSRNIVRDQKYLKNWNLAFHRPIASDRFWWADILCYNQLCLMKKKIYVKCFSIMFVKMLFYFQWKTTSTSGENALQKYALVYFFFDACDHRIAMGFSDEKASRTGITSAWSRREEFRILTWTKSLLTNFQQWKIDFSKLFQLKMKLSLLN